MKKFCVLLTLLSCLFGLSFSLPLIATDTDEDIAFTIASATGVLDTVNTTTATGWACDPTQPNQPLRVIFFVDGVIFAGSTLASLPRESAVAEKCGGNGQHGFVFNFPAGIVRILSGTTKTHTVSAFVIPFPFGFPVQLQNSPQTVPSGSPSPSRTPTPNASPSHTPSVTPTASVTPTPSVTPSVTPSITPSPSISASPNAGAVNGFLDFANTTSAGGWACNPAFPNTPLTVYVTIDNLFFGGTTLASENRTDVTGVCGGSPLHGWTIIFPPNIVLVLENTAAHNVSAFAVPVPPGPPFELHNSPRVVQAPAAVMIERLNRLRPPTKPRGKLGKV